ncbi:MAG: argininosuccinate lyase [Actinomycetota bacterium]|uniref:Argininosuccinate lyase n=1 Tax=uncultured marine bacterium Ant4E12 TaxID=360424 RepID=Q2PYG7_9BACT|nr:argininosuccinate lyase [uncultured marine bacterium Ant4E12]MDE0847000.1 argininosuccinate lyase [Acidimicrobiales bacterium]
MTNGNTLWHGRFAGGPAEALQKLNDSLPFDQRMFREDIAGSRSHVRMLESVGLINKEELDAIMAALLQVENEIAEGTIRWAANDEDIHTAVERRATELAPAAAKMHTGRSRNDQVANDVRLFVKSEVDDLVSLAFELIAVIRTRAEEAHAEGIYLPGYTHMQQAQPVSLAHHLAAYCWMLLRDVDRLKDAKRRTDVSVLGAGALAGSSLPLNPAFTAADLGFDQLFENSLDAVSDRDFVADVLYALTTLGIHLSKLGEELVIWASSEFAFITLDDAFSTGSSMMPQKKNPDIAELARGKAGRLIGNLTGFLATQKGLPLAYNKDLQEDKEPLFDSCDTARLTLLALRGMIQTLDFNAEAMKLAADSPYAAATDLAEYLVEQGLPFRDAHALVGGLVRDSLAGAKSFAELVRDHPNLGHEAQKLLEPGASYQRRKTHGSGGPEAVRMQLDRLNSLLESAL